MMGKRSKEWSSTAEEIINRKHRLRCSVQYEGLENYQNNIWEEYGIT